MSIIRKNTDFGILRSFLWPINRGETLKCLALISLAFLVSFNYTVLKALKDPLIITAESSGAIVLPFLKTWAVLPAAFLAAIIFTKLCNLVGFRKTFFILTSFFLLYFFVFTVFLYPYRELLYLGNKDILTFGTASTGWLNYKGFFRTFAIILYYWPLSSFYVMAELWSSLVLSVLFWGFANQITLLGEAKRFYGVVNLLGNVSGFIAGMVSYYFNIYSRDNLVFKACCAWDHTLYGLMSIVLIAGLFIIIVFHFSYNKFSPNEKKLPITKTTKTKMGITESFSQCFKSKYIFSIALIVLAYNLSMNILEILWKDQTHTLYPKTSDYHSYMTQITMWIGIFSTLFALFVSTFIKYLGWKKTAYFTPIMISLTSLFFFLIIFFGDPYKNILYQTIGLTPLAIIVFIGGLQNSLCRSAKFTFFDATKEISFIPLSKDERIKAKAIIDGIGSRLGKSGGALLVQIMVFIIPTISAMAPYFMMILIPVLSSWFWGITHIGKTFTRYENEEKVSV